MVTTVTCAAAVTLLPAATASAASPVVATAGAVTKAYQHRDGTVTVTGYAYDRYHRASSAVVCLSVDATCVRLARADKSSPDFDRRHGLHGGHRFVTTIHAPRAGAVLALKSHGAHPALLDKSAVSTPGARVVAVARKFVGHARYVDGGASPQRGFDCSGYTMYSYRTGDVAALPHNSNTQRFVAHMHRISRANARPGDLVFYLGGGSAYHVAIYAGNGMQYAAATSRQGIRYQRIWSSAVEFRTNWH